jgi:MarR family transcriptional regulator, organic hydroperoxide resistance regulator
VDHVSTTDALDLDRQICFPLYAATRAVTRRYAEVLADVGLTYPQYLLMLALWTDGPLSVGDLGRRLRLDSGTLTPLLKRLEASGRVERHRDPHDERRVVVSPAPEAEQLRRDVAGVPREVARSIGLDAGQFEQLQHLLGDLIENLDGLGRPA